jgi:hypothetical protein
MLLLTAAIGIGTASMAPAQSPDQNPLAGLRFYVDHDSPSWNQWRAYERAGRDSRANMVGRIAREPKAVWVGRFTKPNFHVKVRRIFENAHAQGAVPIMTVLRAARRPTTAADRRRTRARAPGTTTSHAPSASTES